mmetsp:Transcript_106385/g.307870  ORF Transcript_106385/g.307870 Transcript_106385/m.307870 type:complete len:306 (-) Transcript_106385:543-1460(-)
MLSKSNASINDVLGNFAFAGSSGVDTVQMKQRFRSGVSGGLVSKYRHSETNAMTMSLLTVGDKSQSSIMAFIAAPKSTSGALKIETIASMNSSRAYFLGDLSKASYKYKKDACFPGPLHNALNCVVTSSLGNRRKCRTAVSAPSLLFAMPSKTMYRQPDLSQMPRATDTVRSGHSVKPEAASARNALSSGAISSDHRFATSRATAAIATTELVPIMYWDNIACCWDAAVTLAHISSFSGLPLRSVLSADPGIMDAHWMQLRRLLLSRLVTINTNNFSSFESLSTSAIFVMAQTSSSDRAGLQPQG